MVAPCLKFHQSIFAVFSVQVKCAVNENKRRNNAKTNTKPFIYACHIHDDKDDKEREQSACEDEKVLRFQTLKFRVAPNPFIN